MFAKVFLQFRPGFKGLLYLPALPWQWGNPCLGQQNTAVVSAQWRQVQGLFTERSLKPCVSPVSADRKGQLIFTKALTWEFCTLYLSGNPGREGSANRHVAHTGH